MRVTSFRVYLCTCLPVYKLRQHIRRKECGRFLKFQPRAFDGGVENVIEEAFIVAVIEVHVRVRVTGQERQD